MEPISSWAVHRFGSDSWEVHGNDSIVRNEDTSRKVPTSALFDGVSLRFHRVQPIRNASQGMGNVREQNRPFRPCGPLSQRGFCVGFHLFSMFQCPLALNVGRWRNDELTSDGNCLRPGSTVLAKDTNPQKLDDGGKMADNPPVFTDQVLDSRPGIVNTMAIRWRYDGKACGRACFLDVA